MYDSCIRGFYVYRVNWTPFEEQMLSTARERDNPHDKYAVAVVLDSRTVGHISAEILKTVAFFLKHGGKATCKVNRKIQTFQNCWGLGGSMPNKIQCSVADYSEIKDFTLKWVLIPF